MPYVHVIHFGRIDPDAAFTRGACGRRLVGENATQNHALVTCQKCRETQRFDMSKPVIVDGVLMRRVARGDGNGRIITTLEPVQSTERN